MSRLLFVAVVFASVVSSLGAQSSRPASRPRWLPFGLGAEWVYAGTQEPKTRSLRCIGARLTRLGIAYRCAGNAFGSGWLLETKDGLYSIDDGGLRAIERGAFRYQCRLAALPLGVTLSWGWQPAAMSPQEQPEAAEAAVKDRTAEIVAMRDAVNVPVGVFEAVRVVIAAVPEGAPDLALWFAPGVGVVRVQTTRVVAGRPALEDDAALVKFTPAPAGGDLRALVELAVELRPEWKRFAPPKANPSLETTAIDDATPYRFCRFVLQDGYPRIGLVRAGLLLDFDPRRAESWNALLCQRTDPAPLAEEQRDAWHLACAVVLNVAKEQVTLTWENGEIRRIEPRAGK